MNERNGVPGPITGICRRCGAAFFDPSTGMIKVGFSRLCKDCFEDKNIEENEAEIKENRKSLLITAAPDLYEASRKIMDTLDLLMVEEQFDILDRINADDVNALRYALDKAEGKEKERS